MQAQSGSRGIMVALVILNLSARWEQMVNATAQFLYPQERTPVPTVQGAG
jgi:hypothetical protein